MSRRFSFILGLLAATALARTSEPDVIFPPTNAINTYGAVGNLGTLLMLGMLSNIFDLNVLDDDAAWDIFMAVCAVVAVIFALPMTVKTFQDTEKTSR